MKPTPAPLAESRAAKIIREVFESGRPITYIRSSEEQRVGRVLREVGRSMPKAFEELARTTEPRSGETLRVPARLEGLAGPVRALPVWTWTLTEGLRRDGEAPEPGTQSPRGALDFISGFGSGQQGGAIFHLKDFHEPLRESPEIRRRLRDVYETGLDQRKFVVISSPVRFIPEELERSVIFIELRPPDVVELVAFLREELERMPLQGEGARASEEVLQQLAIALQGLTLDEARYALRRALVASPRLGPESLPAVLEEKRLLINRTGVIEYVSNGTRIEQVGGLEGLKKWLLERQKLFQMRDSLDTEIVPKGILIMGIPGCGKSLCVKAVANQFQLPLYRVDMTEIFSGRHGKPEGAFVAACKMMEDMAPAVLWFDEIEMGLKATESGGEQGRIFGFFLTWMQEKTRGLFVAATANRIHLLPAEMIRKGRFDEVFFVDLPIEEEQIEIFKIHLQRRGQDPSRYNLVQLTKFTTGWTGAEIEQCVVSALTTARLADREITDQDLINIAVKIVPLSRTMKEQINQIRNWAFERAVRATPRPLGR